MMRGGIIAVIAVLSACGVSSAADEAHAPATAASNAGDVHAATRDHVGEDTAILRIRAHFAEIEGEVARYRCRSLDLQGFSAEGGGLEACYAGNELRRLSATYLGETGRGKEQYYFWDNSLEFLFRRSEHYSRPLSGTVVSVDEERFYWSNGRLIRWLKGSRNQELESTDAAEQNREALGTARQLAACAADRMRTMCEP